MRGISGEPNELVNWRTYGVSEAMGRISVRVELTVRLKREDTVLHFARQSAPLVFFFPHQRLFHAGALRSVLSTLTKSDSVVEGPYIFSCPNA